MRRIEVSDADGNSQDVLSSLTSYLVNKQSVKFAFGNWLESLSFFQINRLLDLAYMTSLSDNSAANHLFTIALIALSAENDFEGVPLNEMIVAEITMLAYMELFRRDGLIQFTPPLRLSEPYGITIHFTKKGSQMRNASYDSIVKH